MKHALFRSWPVRCLACLACLMWASQTLRASADALELASPVRAEASAVIAVQQAAQLRTQPAGRAALRMLQDGGWLDRSAGAWAELARALELDPDAAFDALLGARAVLIIEAESDAEGSRGRGGPSWVLISEVDAQVAARLRRGLRPAPRGVLVGRPLFAVEHGRYELAIDRLGRDRALLLLSPAGRGSILEAALQGHARRVEDVSTRAPRDGGAGVRTVSDLVAQLRELGRADVHAAFRLGEAAVAGVGVVREGEFQIALRSTPGMLWAPRDCCIGYSLWPADIVHAVPDDAVLAAFGVRERVNPALNVPMVLPGLPGAFGADVPALLERMRGRMALVVTERRLETPGDQANGPGAIAIDLLAELDQLEPGATSGDRAMASLVALTRRLAFLQGDEDSTPEPVDFEGRFPSAVRSAAMSASTRRFGEEPSLRWVYRASQSPGAGGQDHRAGWMAARLGSGALGEPGLAELGPRTAQAGPGVIVSFGRARPDRLAATLADMGLTELGGVIPAMGWVERVDWIAHPADHARIASKIRVHFRTDRLD